MRTGRTMALRHPVHRASDAAAFLLLLAPLGLIVLSGRQAAAPLQPHTPIDCRCTTVAPARTGLMSGLALLASTASP